MATSKGKKPPAFVLEQDNVWKEILEHYFKEFVAFFFPPIHADIDWSKPYQFLDKELEKIVRDSSLGKRLADKLVKVFLLNGNETWLLIHIEVQGYPDPKFEERMYVYNYRIFDRYRKEVISLAVLTDPGRKYRPKSFKVKRWGFELTFKFPTVKVLDYNKDWAKLETDPSPFAIVVMAHLKTQSLRKSTELLTWKLKLVRMLYERGYEREDVLELFRFLDWLIQLPEELEKQFEDELEKYEEGLQMPYITTIERRGIEKGRQEGLQEGRQEGLQEGRQEAMATMALHLLSKRLGNLGPDLEQRIQQLSLERLQTLSELLLDLSDKEALNKWLEAE